MRHFAAPHSGHVMKLRGRISILLLVAAGGPVVHELRCYLAFGGDRAAAGHGHLCLASPALALTLLCGLALGQLVVQIALSRAQRRRRAVPRAFRIWAAAFLALLALVAIQELAEGLFASARGESPLAMFGHGGWLALPLCAGLALLIATWTRVTARVVARFAKQPATRWSRPPRAIARPRLTHTRRLMCPLALSRAGRAPPLAVQS